MIHLKQFGLKSEFEAVLFIGVIVFWLNVGLLMLNQLFLTTKIVSMPPNR